MPNLNGFEVLKALRGAPDTRMIPFIFLSAAAGATDVESGMKLGADGYLIKPFTRTELLDAVCRQIER